jgi:uncharacterized protein YndB with AHSA1/START domain
MSTKTVIEPVRQSVRVACPLEHAFRTFTEGIGSWWPVETHSLGAQEGGAGVPLGVVLEPRAGGTIAEQDRDGTATVWGEILAWEPPHRLAFTWHLGGAVATEVEVRFRADGDATLVELEHRGWERHAEGGPAMRTSYDGGWVLVLGRYAQAAGT